MRRLIQAFAVLVTSFLLIVFPTSSALAADLTWEAGTTQQIEIDNNLATNLLSLGMQSQGDSLYFELISSGVNRSIYQADIPDSYAGKNYVIEAKFKDGSTTPLSSVKVVSQSNYYNPATDFAGITATSITLFALLTLWNSNDNQSGRRSDEEDEQKAELSGVDTNSAGKDFTATNKMRRSFLPSYSLDEFRNLSTISLSRYSPMFSRLVSDGSYLQYFIGSLVLIFPLLGAFLGYLAHADIVGYGYVTTPALSISLALIVLGVFDAGAAFIGAIVFSFLCYTSNLVVVAFDIRTLLGLCLLWFTPALMANATRTIRKSHRDNGVWDRLTDVVIAPLLTGWAVIGIIKGLNGLAHLTLPLSESANLCGAITALALLIRYGLEEIASYKHEGYMAYVSPSKLHNQDSTFRLISWFIRGFLFLFLSVSFFGLSWQLWVALALFVAPLLIGVIKSKLPNSPLLYQLMPVGIPSIIFMSFLGKFYSGWVDTLTLTAEEKARTIFLIMSIPSFIIMILKSFGRKPKAGDQRWYMREKYNYLYKILGPVFLVFALGLTLGVVG